MIVSTTKYHPVFPPKFYPFYITSTNCIYSSKGLFASPFLQLQKKISSLFSTTYTSISDHGKYWLESSTSQLNSLGLRTTRYPVSIPAVNIAMLKVPFIVFLSYSKKKYNGLHTKLLRVYLLLIQCAYDFTFIHAISIVIIMPEFTVYVLLDKMIL